MIASRHHNQITNRVSQTMALLPWASATILGLVLAGCGTLPFLPPVHLGAQIQQADIPSLAGVIVTAVGETAQEAGLEKDDIIVRLADQPITDLKDLRAVMDTLSGPVEVEVYRPKITDSGEPVSLSPLERFLSAFFGQQDAVKTPDGSWHVIEALTLPEPSPPPDNPQTPGTDATDQSGTPDQTAIEVDQLEPFGSVQTVTPQLAELLGYANWKGVRVIQVLEQSEAKANGLLVGDIIIGFGHSLEDEEKVESTARFQRMISDNAGKEVMLRYVRGQVPHTVRLTLNPYEPPDGPPTSNPDLGLDVVNDSSAPDVLIRGISPDGEADQARLQIGDHITAVDTAVDRQPVDTVEVFWKKIRDKMDQARVYLEIQRDGLTQYVWLQLPPSG